MSWNHAYLEAVGVPSWVPRETAVVDELDVESKVVNDEESQILSKGKIAVTETTAEVYLKALVANPKSKLAIIVSSDSEKKELQKSWKYLKFAWKQWQNHEFPASLYQVDTKSDYSLKQLQQQDLLLVDTCQLKDEQSQIGDPQDANFLLIAAPALSQLKGHKKSWWSLLQNLEQKIQLL